MRKMFGILIGVFISMSAIAQGIVGGGGGAYVCPTASGFEIELVDLFEAKANGIKIVYDNQTPLRDQIQKAINKLKVVNPLFANHVNLLIDHILENLAGGPDVFIPPPTDINANYLKKGCQLQGMMYYDDVRDKLVLDTSLFDSQRTITDFAASYLHEGIYKALRAIKHPSGLNSVMTRFMVGCLMSDTDLLNCLQLPKIDFDGDRLKGKTIWSCTVVTQHNSTESFYAAYSEGILRPTIGSWWIIPSKVEKQEIDILAIFTYFPAKLKSPPKGSPIDIFEKIGGDKAMNLEGRKNELDFLYPILGTIPTFSVVNMNPLTIQIKKKNFECKKLR